MNLHPKVKAVAIVGALLVLATALLQAYGPTLPPTVYAAASLVLTTAAGYLTPSPAPPEPKPLNAPPAK
jgi:uncharacterized membrane protein